MRALILLVIIVAAGFFGYPLLNEGSSGECDALERVALRVSVDKGADKAKPQDQVLGQVAQQFSHGELARAIVKDQYPALPVPVACTMLYWRAVVDPKGFRENAKKLRS
jgi:hypothetical protein